MTSENVKYIKFTDKEHYGEVVKQIGRKFFDIVDGVWKRCGVNIGYFYPDAPEFGCYEYISEEEALSLLNM